MRPGPLVGSLSSVAAGKARWSSSTSCGVRPVQKSALQELPCPIRVSPIPSGSRSTKGTSHRGSPAPVTVGWSGFLRGLIPEVYWQACVQPQLELEQGSRTDWGLASVLEGKHKAAFGENPSVLPPGAPSSVVPPPGSHHGGLPLQGQHPQSCEGMWLSVAYVCHPTSGCPRTLPCILLSLACTPCLLCQTTEKTAYFSRGMLPLGWCKGTSARLFLHEILVTCGQCSGDWIEGARLLGLVSDPSAH